MNWNIKSYRDKLRDISDILKDKSENEKESLAEEKSARTKKVPQFGGQVSAIEEDEWDIPAFIRKKLK